MSCVTPAQIHRLVILARQINDHRAINWNRILDSKLNRQSTFLAVLRWRGRQVNILRFSIVEELKLGAIKSLTLVSVGVEAHNIGTSLYIIIDDGFSS